VWESRLAAKQKPRYDNLVIHTSDSMGQLLDELKRLDWCVKVLESRSGSCRPPPKTTDAPLTRGSCRPTTETKITRLPFLNTLSNSRAIRAFYAGRFIVMRVWVLWDIHRSPGNFSFDHRAKFCAITLGADSALLTNTSDREN
jgi:hypothetical protein